MKIKIILVDDEPEILEILHKFLLIEDYSVRCAQSGREAVELFNQERAHVVITDIRMPGMDGLELLRTVKHLDEQVEVIILTGHASIDVAISALRNDGAFDFLTKPLENLEDLLLSIEKALDRRRLRTENALLLEEMRRHQIHLETANKGLLHAQKALKESRSRFENLYDKVPIGYLTINAQGIIKEVNQTGAGIFRCAKAFMRYKSILDFIPYGGKEAFISCRAALAKNGHHTCQMLMCRSDDETFYANIEGLAILGDEKQINQIRITISDISDRLKTERALKESEARYRTFVENFKGIAFRLHPTGRPIFYHGAVLKTTGYTETDLITNHPGWEAIIHPEDLDMVQSRRMVLYKPDDHHITHEYRIRHRDGGWRWVREHIQDFSTNEGEAVALQGVIFDITEHKELQVQYMESRKLDAVATMAGGIAHQFNNSLAGLMGNVELLEMEVAPDHKAANYVAPMMTLIQKMAQLTSQLLAYARGGKYRPSQIPLHDLVSQSLNLISHRLNRNIDVKLDLLAQTDRIKADTAQMQMVIIAVLDNAAEAMPNGGPICISTKSVDISNGKIAGGKKRQAGHYICLSIRDNGCGMDCETAKKIFDPFFTTKFIGRGLGLSAAHGIAINHNGWMEVDSRPKGGTEIRIYLPLEKDAELTQPDDADGQTQPGHGTVLVIEDEKIVLKAVHKLLERLHYRVLEAPTGHTALEILRTFNGQIDVALLDVRLPDIEAGKLFSSMLNIRPDLKVIVSSGYDKDGPVESLLEAGALGFLQKPFATAQLSNQLQAAMKKSPAGKTGSPHLKVV